MAVAWIPIVRLILTRTLTLIALTPDLTLTLILNLILNLILTAILTLRSDGNISNGGNSCS